MFSLSKFFSFFSILILFFSANLNAGHKMNPNDLELDIDNAEIVKEGRGWFAQRSAFCHGGDGIGGKGPCLTCGKFKYSGNTNADILTTISIGVPKSRGGSMGAFGTSMSAEAIIAVITFMRSEERRRIASGEIEDPYIVQEPMVFPE